MIKCSTNIRTEIFFANEINKAGFYHNFHRLLIYMGEDEGNSILDSQTFVRFCNAFSAVLSRAGTFSYEE